MARVLITGATGCLGHRLTQICKAEGDEVLALGRNPADLAMMPEGVRYRTLDLTQMLPSDLMEGVEIVYHCAALSSAWGPAEDFEAVNVRATGALLNAARRAKVRRFVFASSPSIYADGTDRLNVAEDAALPQVFASHYARTKHAAERLVMSAEFKEGLETSVMRPRAIYGRGDRSLMPRLLGAIKRGRVPMIEGGSALIDVTHVTDAALAMRLMGHHPDAVGEIFNISSGQCLTFREIVTEVTRMTQTSPREVSLSYKNAQRIAGVLEGLHHIFAPAKEPVLTKQAVASLGKSLTLDISKAKTVLGYRPSVPLAQGMRDYA